MNNLFKATAFAAAACFALSSCSAAKKKESDSEKAASDPAATAALNAEEDYSDYFDGKYKSELVTVFDDIDYLSSPVKLSDGSGYIAMASAEYEICLCKLSSDFTKAEKLIINYPEEFRDEPDINPYFCVSPDGSYTILTIVRKCEGMVLPKGGVADPDFDYDYYYNNAAETLYITSYSPDGSIRSNSVIEVPDEYSNELGGIDISNAAAVNDGELLISCYGGNNGDSILLCHADGSAEPIEINADLGEYYESRILSGGDGKTYIDCFSSQRGDEMNVHTIMEYNADEKKFEAPIYDKADAENGYASLFTGDSEYLFLSMGDTQLSGIKGDGTSEKLFAWADTDILRCETIKTGEHEFICINNSEDGGAKIYRLIPRTPADTAGLQTITLGVFGNSDEVNKWVNSFNTGQDKYRVETIDYQKQYQDSQMQGGDFNYDDYMKQQSEILKLFSLDMVSGKGADIIMSYDHSMIELLGKKGALANLYDFMENDTYINKESILPNVREALESKDGSLYSFTPGFTVSTLAVKTKFFNKENWTVRDMISLYDSSEAQHRYDGKTKQEMFAMMLNGMTELVDIENSECYFDTPEFIDILKFCGRFVDEVDLPDKFEEHTAFEQYYLDKLYWIRDDKDFIERVNLGGNDDISWQKYSVFYNEPFTLVGFPSTDGRGGKLVLMSEYAINSQSSVKEGAWEFLKTAVDAQIAGNSYSEPFYYGFPTLEDEFAKKIEYCSKLHDIDTESGEWIEVPSRENKMWILYPPSAEESADYERYVRSCSSLAEEMDIDAKMICQEEAEAYFKGERSAEEAAKLMQSRISILVSEKG